MLKPLQIAAALLVVASLARAADEPPKTITIDEKARSISVPCKIAPRKLASLQEVYPIEVIASWGEPKGKKAHETVITFDVNPSEIHKALEKIGLKPGKPALGEGAKAAGPEVKIQLELPGKKKIAIEKALTELKTGKPIPSLKWYFTGSVMTQPDPDKPEMVYGADITGTLIAIFPVTDQTVFQTNLTMKEEPLLKLETNKTTLPAEGTAVNLIIEAK